MRIIYDLDELTETARGWLAGSSVEELRENLGADLPDLLIAVSVSVGTIRILDNVLWDSGGFWLT